VRSIQHGSGEPCYEEARTARGCSRTKTLRLPLLLVALVTVPTFGCGRSLGPSGGAGEATSNISDAEGVVPTAPTRIPLRIEDWRFVDDLPHELAVFQSVFWDARDTTRLRKLIRETPLVHDKTILEIGTGTGLIALCCVQGGACKVVATDVNPAAVANAAYNADLLAMADRIEVRQVPLDRTDAFSVVDPRERFNLILSNPPWEEGKPASLEDFAMVDEDFHLLDSLLKGLRQHLAPGGKAYLVYGCTDAIRAAELLAARYDLQTRRMDDRDLDRLPRLFLPGMVLEVVPAAGGAAHRVTLQRRTRAAADDPVRSGALRAPSAA
jgi:predicted RNA methylase